MTTPTARERELAASVTLGAGNWTEQLAQLLADYREELRHGRGPLECNQCGHSWPASQQAGYCHECGACPPDCWEAAT